jgi:hypothetical protein
MSLAERRQIIFQDALRAADRRRHRRLAARAGATGCILGIVAITAFTLVNRREHHIAPIVVQPESRPSKTHVTTTGPKVVVQIIRAGDVQPKWQTLSDEQFLAAMADAGRPSGVIELNGKAVVVPLQ